MAAGGLAGYGLAQFEAECRLVVATPPAGHNALPRGVRWATEAVDDALGRPQLVLRGTKTLFRAAAAVVKPELPPADAAADGLPWAPGDDPAAAPADAAAPTHLAYVAVYVMSYSPAFGIPVLHFTVTRAADSFPLRDGADLRREVFPTLNSGGDGQEPGAVVAGPLVTPSMHELLDAVMFFVHPCDAHTLLRAAPPDAGRSAHVAGTVEKVFALVGPFVGMFEAAP